MLVQQKVVVTEMAACHMPVKVFRLQVEDENIGKQEPQAPGDLDRAGARQISAEIRGRVRYLCVIRGSLSHDLQRAIGMPLPLGFNSLNLGTERSVGTTSSGGHNDESLLGACNRV